jgi:hypothetical protein
MVSELDLIKSLAAKLGEYVRESSTKYKFNCPECGSEKSLHLNPLKDGGPCICIACGLRANAVSILKLKGSQAVTAIKLKSPDWNLISQICDFIVKEGEIRSVHGNWLKGRGIRANSADTPEISSMIVRSSDKVFHSLLKNFTLHELTECGFCIQRGEPPPMAPGFLGANRILIPYFNEEGKPVYIRSRYAGNTEGVKYLAPPKIPGVAFSWGWETVRNKSDYVIITEGEFKAQAAKQLGFPCVALPGMNSGYENIAMLCVKKNVETVYVLFDTETEITSNGISKMQGVRAAMNSLCETLLDFDLNPIVCELPALDNMKTDLDGFILKRGLSSARELIKILSEGRPFGT